MSMQNRYDSSIVSRVQQSNDIVEVVSEHVNLMNKGKEMVGLCPFHNDHRPSLYVNPAKQIFKCFACGAGGDVLKFVQMRENLSFPQSIERLAHRAGIKIRTTKTKNGPQNFPDINPNELARVNSWAAKYFHSNLIDKQKGETTRDYIASRGLTESDINKWQLGLALNEQDNLLKKAKNSKIPINLLQNAGLITGKGGVLQDRFINRLMFPISDVTGRIIGFGGRTLNQKGAKYINSPTTALFDKSNNVYGLSKARDTIISTGTAVVAEGYTDCIMAHSRDCSNVVATLGTSFTKGHARLLKRYAKRIILIFDSDTAGIEAANRALEICLLARIDIKLALVPEGKDPCEYIRHFGKANFDKLLKSAVDVFEFKWQRLTKSLGSSNALVDNKTAIEEFLQSIATGLQAGYLPIVDRGLIVNRISKITGLENKQINAEIAKRISRITRNEIYTKVNQKVQTDNLVKGLSASSQREIIEVLLNKPELFETTQDKISEELFDTPQLREIATVLLGALRAREKICPKTILSRIESADTASKAVELMEEGEKKGNFDARLNGALKAIENLQKQKKRIQLKMMEDQKQFLKHFSEAVGKKNLHNIGMS